MLGQVVKDFLTEKDGQSYCPLRALLVLAVLFYLGLELRDALTLAGYNFSGHAKDFANGLASMLGWGGAAVTGKSFTETE